CRGRRREQRDSGGRRHRRLPAVTGGVARGAPRRHRPPAMSVVVTLLAAAIGLIASAVGVSGMLGVATTWRAPALLPLGGISLVLYPLAGFFLALVGVATILASLSVVGVADREPRGRVAYLLFISAMVVVPLAANALTFLIAWELMSLASYVLVLHNRRARE